MSPLPLHRVDDPDVQANFDLVGFRLPAVLGSGRIEVGRGEVTFTASATADALSQPHSLGAGSAPVVLVTSRDVGVHFAQPLGVSDTDFPVAAFSLTGARSATVAFNYLAFGQVTD